MLKIGKIKQFMAVGRSLALAQAPHHLSLEMRLYTGKNQRR
jgi:hypothetical protein